MNSSYYPEVDNNWVLPLRSIFDQMVNDPLFLERGACPYDTDLVEGLRALWASARVGVVAGVKKVREDRLADAEDKTTSLQSTLETLFDELKDFQANTVAMGGEDGVVDVKDQMAYFRTATSLLDKIMGLQERSHNVKAVSDFQRSVINVFDQVLTPEQRTSALEILGQ